jgi:hypothetical protein
MGLPIHDPPTPLRPAQASRWLRAVSNAIGLPLRYVGPRTNPLGDLPLRRGSTYIAAHFTACVGGWVSAIHGPYRSCFDNAASEGFFSALETRTPVQASVCHQGSGPRAVVTAWCHDFYHLRNRHSSASMLPPVDYKRLRPSNRRRRRGSLHDSREAQDEVQPGAAKLQCPGPGVADGIRNSSSRLLADSSLNGRTIQWQVPKDASHSMERGGSSSERR